MATNFLEQLAAEWLEYQGYFVRRNVRVSKRAKQGGYDGELDIVAFHPETKHLVHIEPSMDSHSWEKREARYKKKFSAGRKHIPELFKGLDLPSEPEQIALLGLASTRNYKTLGGGRVQTIQEYMEPIIRDLVKKRVANAAVPESFVLLRTLQFLCEHRDFLSSALNLKPSKSAKAAAIKK